MRWFGRRSNSRLSALMLLVVKLFFMVDGIRYGA